MRPYHISFAFQIDPLSSAIDFATGCSISSIRCRLLLRTARVVLHLRRSVYSGDWSGVSVAMLAAHAPLYLPTEILLQQLSTIPSVLDVALTISSEAAAGASNLADPVAAQASLNYTSHLSSDENSNSSENFPEPVDPARSAAETAETVRWVAKVSELSSSMTLLVLAKCVVSCLFSQLD
jgi:hypothetical protein